MWLQAISIYPLSLASRFGKWWGKSDQTGQSMVEYAIVAALIALVAMGAVQALGGGIAQVFQNILGKIQGLA